MSIIGLTTSVGGIYSCALPKLSSGHLHLALPSYLSVRVSSPELDRWLLEGRMVSLPSTESGAQ